MQESLDRSALAPRPGGNALSSVLAAEGSFVAPGPGEFVLPPIFLGITKPSVRMDSQAKYCSIARGDGDVYLRLPVSATYEEKIWVRPPTSLISALLTRMIG